MPFVLAKAGKIENLDVFQTNIQHACYAAWVSMDESFLGSDIGGAVDAKEESIGRDPQLIFVYVDRGDEFHNRLHQRLKTELNARGIMIDDIDLRRTKRWFPDPTWSQAPCSLPHKGEYDNVPCHEGASPTSQRLREEKPDERPSRQPFNT